jgi:hypothetical protein
VQPDAAGEVLGVGGRQMLPPANRADGLFDGGAMKKVKVVGPHGVRSEN